MVDEPQVLMSHHRAWSNEWLWKTDSFISGEGSSQTAIPSRLAKLFDLALSGDKLGIHLAVKSFEPTNRQHREIWKIFDRGDAEMTKIDTSLVSCSVTFDLRQVMQVFPASFTYLVLEKVFINLIVNLKYQVILYASHSQHMSQFSSTLKEPCDPGVNGVLALLSTPSFSLEIKPRPREIKSWINLIWGRVDKKALIYDAFSSASHSSHRLQSHKTSRGDLNVTFDFMVLVTAMHLHLLFALPDLKSYAETRLDYQIKKKNNRKYPRCCRDVEGKSTDIRVRDTMWPTSNSSSTEYFITCSVVVQLRIGIIAETHSSSERTWNELPGCKGLNRKPPNS
ncbi:hypothetical protein MJG53_005265 [Ovis ammon polii x Ovis aries]|uniref:Uncharacterized protein n=1 Tax=Ovis ammon polii x Ovis aries TaxID=2918886 RepID=A0ACB9VCC4_9CETA|nr:hypothetical protein MJG53_005265 [Ovis ammon polii x Ovis aries]